MEKRFKYQRHFSPNRFLVYYDGGIASIAALRHACQTAGASTEVVAVYLARVPAATEPDYDAIVERQNAKLILAGAIVNAQTYGLSIRTEIVPAPVQGPAMTQLAARHGNATIFLGVEQEELDKKQNPFAEYVQKLAPSDVVLVAV